MGRTRKQIKAIKAKRVIGLSLSAIVGANSFVSIP